MDPVLSHFGTGHWIAFVIYVLAYGLFIAFLPFYMKSRVKPAAAYLGFAVAFVLEMFGVPKSLKSLRR